MTVRMATVDDLPVLLHHRRSMFVEMGFTDEAASDAMVASAGPFIAASLKDGTYRAWLVEEEGQVVAGGGLAIVGFQPTPIDPSPRRAWVLNVYTEPSHRRKGLARLVMQTIIAWCREQGFRSLLLHASEEGRPLYEKLGFGPTSEMRLTLD